jgi:PmbA protein
MSIDDDWKHFSDIIHKAVRALEKKKVTHVEAFFTSYQTTEVAVRNSEILTQNKLDDLGVGFRVVVPTNKVGVACTNNLSEKAVLKAGEKAIAVARTSSEVPDFALPEASRPTKVEGLYDTRVAEINVEDVVETAKRAVDAAEDFDGRVTVKDGRVLFVSGWRGIVNTLGVDFEERESRVAIYLGGSGEQDGEVTGSCYDSALSRKADLQPEEVGENVGKMVVAMFNPKPLKSFRGSVIFGPEAVSYQLCDVLIEALKSDNVIAGHSVWTQKLAQMVASENLTITDNALLENGFASRSFDDEGCCSQETSLIRKGKLESFLHNAGSAKALGMRNTGNASRFSSGFDMIHMIIGNGYRTKPEIYPSNLIIQPGKRTKEELLSEMQKGVLIESMAGFAQKGSGIISAQLSRAFFVQNGEIQYPIKGGMVSGVGFDWFKQVASTSKDVKQFPNAILPSFLVENVKVVGA